MVYSIVKKYMVMHDDTQRFIAFQIAFVDWLNQWQHKPDVVHCHDYHAGLDSFHDEVLLCL